MKIKARVGSDYKEEVITELDQFVIETDKGEFRISYHNGRLRVSESTWYRLAVMPQSGNCLDIEALAH